MNSHSSPSQTKRQAAMIVATIMTMVYLTYRGLFTLNLASPYAVAASLALYAAECYGGLLLLLFFFQIWDVRNPAPQPPLVNRLVDVLIPTYNEDPDLLRGTITAALKIDYPHRTYVLDDGRRPEVRALCEELGVEYVTRPDNKHAKAGNLNHALKLTDGEFVVIFDADHVADRHFIDRLIGYFADEKMGFVQTPHAFYNFDAYQGILDYRRGVYWEEGMLFYNVTQPGKNRWNGVTFCGSAAMFRRQALVDAGLVATESITEDMHTGLRMHAKGWRSLFINERLISALAAQDITSFNTQRLRWGEGNLGIFAFDNPLTIPGLTLAQRICYLGSMLSWTTGVQKLLIYLTPMLMLITDIGPIKHFDLPLGILTAVYMTAVWGGFKIASNGYGNLWGIELSQMIGFWTQVQATWRALFRRRLARFIVTAKRGRQSNSVLRHMLPQILYLVGSTISITWAFTRYWLELSHDMAALSIGTALLLVHSILAWTVIRRALRPRDYRASWRHPAALHVLYRSVDANGQPVVDQGVTRDINENGVAFVTFAPLTANHEVNLSISGGGQTVHCRGLIRAQTLDGDHRTGRRARAQAYSYRVEFLEPSAEQLEMLWWLGAQFAVSRQYERFGGGQFGVPGEDVRRIPTRDDEQVFELPLTIDLGRENTLVAVSDTLGPETMTALVSEPLRDRATVRFELATPYGSTKGWARVVESESRTIAGQLVYETRFRCERFAGESRQSLQSTIGRQASKDLARVVRLSPARRPSGIRRAATLVVGTTAVAATLVFAGVSVVERDEAAMARIEAGHPVTPEQVDRLVGMVRSVSTATSVNEGELVRLRGAMMRLDRKKDVATLDEVIARIIPQTLDGQILKGMALQNLRRNQEADEIFSALLAHLDELYNDATRRDVLLAAARNAANLGQQALAVERYARLPSLGALRDDVRDEYAGVLTQAGFADQAIEVLRDGPAAQRSLHLLASIYASQKKFDQAIEVYQRLLDLSPQDVEASRGLADNALWSHDFDTAVRGYRAILARTPGDVELEGQLAAALLGGRHFDQALAAYAALLDRQPRRGPLIDGFLLAAAGSDKISASQLRRLSAMFDHRHQFHDERLASHLLNALVRHGTPAQVLPLLEEIVAQKPQDVQLRLQLAGVFDEFHRPAEADRIFAGLLGQLAEFPSIDTRRQVLWAAARNAANRDDFATAAERFAQLQKLGPLSDEALAEYAGVLVQANRRADAIKLLEESPPRPHTLYLLASIYASEKHFDDAIKVYEQLLKESPGDETALRGLADNALWSRDYATAAARYREILAKHSSDLEVRQQLAKALLGGHYYEPALAEYTALLERLPGRPDLEDGFLMAAGGAAHLELSEARRLDIIYARHDRRTDDRFLMNLLNALAKHDRQAQVLPLLESLSKRAPQDPALRLRLADALQHSGRFAEADEHYRWLLSQPTAPN